VLYSNIILLAKAVLFVKVRMKSFRIKYVTLNMMDFTQIVDATRLSFLQ